ncbi:MAG: hypothetical protein PHU23_03285 [Dehalococcoidales bacterium]|nr:hypothetical protein [Dehalococcoidales bacterium]
MIEINSDVKTRMREILDKNPGKYFRIVVEGDGCAGPYFRLSLDEADVNDVPAVISGIEILLSDQVRRLAEISTIKVFVNQIDEELL